MKDLTYLIEIGISAVLSFLFLFLLFFPLERAFPAVHQKFFRDQWYVDLTYFVLQYLFWNLLVLWLLNYFYSFCSNHVPAEFRSIVASQPFYIKCIEVLLLSDFLIYWGHRWQHNNEFLWRFHKVHHSSIALDWLAAYREHPLDSIYTVGIINLPAVLLGFSLESIVLVVAFRGVWAIFIHSNIRLNLGFIKYIVGSPSLHHWHHFLDRDAGNYANLSPLMDLIFGTHYDPGYEPPALGINEPFASNYIGQMIEPVLPKKWYTERVKKWFKNKRHH